MSDRFVIFVGEAAWRVGCVAEDGTARIEPVRFPEEADLEARVAAARQHLVDAGYADEPVLVALPSSWCLCATLSTEDLERTGRRRAMGFRLEEHLPISAEEVVADYSEPREGEALGVAAEIGRLEAMIEALEAARIDVRHVAPTALLAAARVAETHPEAELVLAGPAPDEGRDPEGGYDLVALAGGEPAHWLWLGDDEAAVADRLVAAADHEGPLRIALIGRDDPVRDVCAEMEVLDAAEDSPRRRDEAAALHAARVLEGAASLWIDLRCDALAAPDRYRAYRKPVTALVAAGIALLVSVSVVMQWRGRRYEALARAARDAQVEVFREALPEQRRIPASIKSRLAGERRTLAGLGGKVSADEAAARARKGSALAHLAAVLESLPADLRFRIVDLNIEPDRIRIDGQARSHAEAERVAMALRGAGRYDVKPPKTRALDARSVSFLFTATPVGSAAEAGEATP